MDRLMIEDLPNMFEHIAKAFVNKKEELCNMDANMGDGDLGLTMSKGFCALPDLVRSHMKEGDIGKILFKSGMMMASVVPSTMGTLMASGIMEAGKALQNKTELNAENLAIFFEYFAFGIQKRGKCNLGDRTIYDALYLAGDYAKKAFENEKTLIKVAKNALEGAKQGVEATKTMLPKFGKAAVFANKAQGIADQGAVAGCILVESICEFIEAS